MSVLKIERSARQSPLSDWNTVHVRLQHRPPLAAFRAVRQELECILRGSSGRRPHHSSNCTNSAQRAAATVRERLIGLFCDVVGNLWLPAAIAACDDAVAGALLAESTNLAAKLLDPSFYELKGVAVYGAALHPAVHSGSGW